jgi:hypothetical protein
MPPQQDNPVLTRRQALAGSAAVLAGAVVTGSLSAAEKVNRVLVVVGPSNHPPGTHEVAAGGRLLGHCIEAAKLAQPLRASVVNRWPESKSLSDVASVVFIGDLFPPEVMPDRDRIFADLTALMRRGAGMVCIHFATGLAARHVTPEGDHPLLHWIGGYFATGCKHHQSIARIFKEATIQPAAVDHPVLRGWTAFTLHDEPYINNYFGKNGPGKNVSILATAQLPPEAPKREGVAWAVTREDGGRGVGIVMPHFYRNWKVDALRTLILNSIVWTTGSEVPREGVQVALPDLATFKPDALEPAVRKKK